MRVSHQQISRVIQALRAKNTKLKIVNPEALSVGCQEEVFCLLNRKIAQLARSSTSPDAPVIFTEIHGNKDKPLPDSGDMNATAVTLARAIHSLLTPRLVNLFQL